MISTDFLRQLDRFAIVLKKRVNAQYAGSKESKYCGHGLVFADYREYVPGDDVRAIDWRAYGRTDKLFIRRYEEERNLILHAVVDASASMDFGNSTTKFDYGAMLGIGFAYMALRNNEKFVLSTFADKLNILRPKKGMNQLITLVEHLNKMRPEGKSRFMDSLEQYKELVTSKAFIVVISDFLFDVNELRETLYKYKRSEVVLIQVLDERERDLDVKGDIILEDAETRSTLHTFISRRLVQKYEQKLNEHIYSVKDVADRIGAKFVTVTTGTPVFDVFHQVLKMKG